MKMMNLLQTWLLITVMALSANGAVNAKVALGGINLKSEVHWGLDVSKPLNALGISKVSATRTVSSPLAPNAGELPNNWKLSIGSKLDHADDKIGHAVVRLEGSNGFKVTKGKWPIMEDGTPGFSDIVSPIKGMRGGILDDTAYVKSGADKFVFQDYLINALQAKNAWSVIKAERRAGQNDTSQYKLFSDQCTTFACSVVRGAGEKPPYAGYPKRPTKLYESISKGKK